MPTQMHNERTSATRRGVDALVLALCLTTAVRAEPSPRDCKRLGLVPHVISTDAVGHQSLTGADLDGDGDMDVLGAFANADKIVWHENTDGLGTFGSQRIIDVGADGASSVFTADLDGDGDIDVLAVLSKSFGDDKIAWYENMDGGGTFGPQRIITTELNALPSVFAADLDGDGDMDVLSSSLFDSKIAWYENTDGLGTFGPQQTITTNAAGARSVFSADLDGDGDADVLSASFGDNKIAWYENIDGRGTFGPQRVITTAANQAATVFAADMDGDGDIDVLSTHEREGRTRGGITWYENIDGLGTFGPQRVIIEIFGERVVALASDLDGDGDTDVLSVPQGTGGMAWYENICNTGTFGSQCVIPNNASSALAIFAADLDGDGDKDIIAAFRGKVAWFENKVDGKGSDCNANDINDDCDIVDHTSPDCNANIVPDECEVADLTSPDCNGNTRPDECDVDDGRSQDCNRNAIPDQCDVADQTSADCNDNGRPDECDIRQTGQDEIDRDGDDNGILDECELADMPSRDCNGNGRLDKCDIAARSSQDCNLNASPDECDLNDQTSTDCNGNGRPDECDAGRFGDGSSQDCNSNFVPDECDLADQSSADCNANERPDECDLAAREFENSSIITRADRPRSVFAADLDGDGDIDVLSASSADDKIAWYQNTNGLGTFGPPRVITTEADGAFSVFAADLDGDGDVDVLSASIGDNKITWYENSDGLGMFEPRLITDTAYAPQSVFAADLDRDGDIDVLSASFGLNMIAWYENSDGRGAFDPLHIISLGPDGYAAVFAADLDGDGDIDVLSSSWGDGEVAWYENIDGLGRFGPRRVITTDAPGARSVFAIDLDGDGAIDVLSASSTERKIAWYKNTDGLGMFGPPRVITTDANGARSVFAADLDSDGDIDVLSASNGDDKIAWYENIDGLGLFVRRVITTSANGAESVFAADVDGDGDLDVLSASANDDKIAWYQNNPVSYDCNGNGIPDECEPDDDGDADDVTDICDLCVDSLTDEFLTVVSCVTTIDNVLFDDGCTMADLIAECEDAPRRRGDLLRCVKDIAGQWLADGIISGREHGRIVSCAAIGKKRPMRIDR